MKLHPELLMAACQGESELLSKLLNEQQDAVVIEITKRPVSSSGDEAAPNIGLALGSVLHVVASSGDDGAFLKSADVVCAKARHLLGARNGNGDTPLQCAARAGNTRMASHLVAVAKSGADAGGDHAIMLEAMLRNQNEQGETALHDALRLADKENVRLMATALLEFGRPDKNGDAGLAHIESFNGTSPLYLAVMLGHDAIAEKLYQTADKWQRQPSYSGPGGQNALHAAVLRSYGMAKKLLKWNKGLTKQRDQTTGSTPLHMAATWVRGKRVIELLLEADRSSAFLSDDKGSFPIHAAAARTSFPVARLILSKCPGCAALQDGQGKTFLHVAVEKGRPLVVGFACLQPRFAPILNIRDNDGNTALHLAAEVGVLWTFYSLIQNPRVQLDLANNEGQTAMDIADKWKPEGIVYVLDPRMRICVLLRGAAAKNGIFRRDWLREDHAAKRNMFYEDYEKSISDSTQFIGIGSVLIVTVAFAAGFTLPGAFIGTERYGDDKGPCTLHGAHQENCAGKATLAYDNAFRAFVVANTLALTCSALVIFQD